MANIIRISKKNEAFIRVDTDEGIRRELSEYLTFTPTNSRWDKRTKPNANGKVYWDGKLKLFDLRTKTCYYGLQHYIEEWASDQGYTVENNVNNYGNELSLIEANEFIESLNLPKVLHGLPFEIRDYQVAAFVNAIRKIKSMQLSPTASGKSIIIYLILRWILKHHPDYKAMLIVPTVALTSQMISDFKDYGWNADDYCHQVYAGKEKDHTDKQIIVTTWQSIQYLSSRYFEQFDVVIGDEAHECDAPQLKHILSSLTNAVYRVGTTGTLSGVKSNRWTLEGLFGQVHIAARTHELIEQGYLSKLLIKCLVLKHPDTACKLASKKGFTYDIEIDYLVSSKLRNKYITNLAVSLKGNTLILFRFVEKHGMILEEMIRDKLKDTNRNVYFIYGMTEIEEREQIRKILETETDAILIASVGTFSRGSNVRRLHNIIASHPMKAKVKTLQSIGRSLRLEGTKEYATWYDIADDLRWKEKENYTLKHYAERLKIYAAEKFKYKVYPIALKQE